METPSNQTSSQSVHSLLQRSGMYTEGVHACLRYSVMCAAFNDLYSTSSAATHKQMLLTWRILNILRILCVIKESLGKFDHIWIYWTICDVMKQNEQNLYMLYAAFRLACRSPHCLFVGDFCTIAQAPLATEGRPSGKQHQANQSITSPLCSKRQTADRWLLFNFRAMSRGEKTKAVWPLRAATLKWQAVIRRWNGNAV